MIDPVGEGLVVRILLEGQLQLDPGRAVEVVGFHLAAGVG